LQQNQTKTMPMSLYSVYRVVPFCIAPCFILIVCFHVKK